MDTNTQIFFNAVADAIKGVYDQRCGSYTEDTKECLYRGKDGTKCAVGFIIKDEFYSEDIELECVLDAPVEIAVNNSLGFEMDSMQKSILSSLQSAHDSIHEEEQGTSFQKLFLDRAFQNLTDLNQHNLIEFIVKKYPEFKEEPEY